MSRRTLKGLNGSLVGENVGGVPCLYRSLPTPPMTCPKLPACPMPRGTGADMLAPVVGFQVLPETESADMPIMRGS